MELVGQHTEGESGWGPAVWFRTCDPGPLRLLECIPMNTAIPALCTSGGCLKQNEKNVNKLSTIQQRKWENVIKWHRTSRSASDAREPSPKKAENFFLATVPSA